MAGVRPIKRVVACDRDMGRASMLAEWVGDTLNIEASANDSIAVAVAASDIIVTCTTATAPILTRDMVPSGCLIAAVGADNPDKQELDPALFAPARILVDDAAQCAGSGDLAHAIRAGTTSTDRIAASLAELAAGARSGRDDDAEIVIFDSTGTGVQDVAAAVAAFEAVLEAGSTVG